MSRNSEFTKYLRLFKNSTNSPEVLFDPNKKYHELLETVVDESYEQIETNYNRKNIFRWFYSIVIFVILIAETAVLFVLMWLGILKDAPLVASFVSLMVETIGLIAIMVRYIFDDKTEIEITKSIKEVVTNYKKSS